jgi:AcrR family transcriptional regulator
MRGCHHSIGEGRDVTESNGIGDDGAPAEPIRSAQGRPLGVRALSTRECLLNTTAQLLQERPYWTIGVTDIARESGVSTATFYQYFDDFDGAIAELAAAVSVDFAAITSRIEQAPLRGPDAQSEALAIVALFWECWQRHRALLAVLEGWSLQGHDLYRTLRSTSLRAVTDALQVAIECNSERGGTAKDARARAFVLISALAHTASHPSAPGVLSIEVSDVEEILAEALVWAVSAHH